MRTILKSMVALSLVSSVAFGAKIYDKDNTGRYIEKDVKIEDDWMLLEFAKKCNFKLEYGKDENNVERIIAVMANGEKAIVEYVNWGTDDVGDFFVGNSDLWVKKDGKRGILSGLCPIEPISLEEFKKNEKFYKEVDNKTLEDHKKRLEDYKKELKNYIPDFSEEDYLVEYIQDTNRLVEEEERKKKHNVTK